MSTLKIKNTFIGDGIPKICVSIMGNDEHEILDNALKIHSATPDIVEWRADFYNNIFNTEKTLATLFKIREIFKNTPIIFTIRTQNEGGNIKINTNDYININKEIIKSNLADLIDIEIDKTQEQTITITEFAHSNNCYIIGSHHNFNFTPTTEKLIQILKKIESLNCDIVKLAVMPQDKIDVINLLNATANCDVKRPIITMSMSKLGTISRISGNIFGSCITFASLEQSSAPGQINIDFLRQILNTLN